MQGDPSATALIPDATPPLRLLLVAALLCAAAGCGRGGHEVDAVVLVTLDTTRADRIGCYGNAAIETPVLDRVAREGVLFEQASAVSPLTLPSHASILTGRYPEAHGARHNGMFVVPPAERTLAEVFRERGFVTGAFVAAFPLSSVFGLSQGFDRYDERFEPPGADRGFTYDERDAAAVTAAAIPWLASMKGRRFFLWVHYFDPHFRYVPPEPFRQRYATNPYDGEIAFVDAQLGRLLEALEGAADPRRTILAVAGDHGEGLREHGESSHGLFVYETTIRAPLILWAPGRLDAGVRVSEPVSLVDLFPTILRLAGAGDVISAGPPVHGTDLAAAAAGAGGPATDREIAFESLLAWLEHGWSPLHGIRSGRWKYIEAPRPELYDLASDPSEASNMLANDADAVARERASQLSARLAAHREKVGAGTGVASRREMDPETVERLRSLGYLQGGVPTGGTARAAEEPGSTLRDPKDGLEMYEAINDAGLLLRRGDRAGAIAALRGLLDRDPANTALQRRLGEALISARRFDEADRLLRPLISNAPEHYWVEGLLARAAEAGGDLDRALALYRASLEKDPDTASARVRIASVLRSQNRLRESLAEAGEVLSARPDHLAALELATDTLRDLGKLGDAVGLWEQAREAAPDDADVLAVLGRLLIETGRVDRAGAVVADLRRVAPEDARTPLLLGVLAVVEGKTERAVTLLETAEERAPEDADALYWLAAALIESGRVDAAEPRVLRLVEKAPASPLAHRTLGLLRLAQGRRAEAVEAFRRALELDPADPVAGRSLRQLTAPSP